MEALFGKMLVCFIYVRSVDNFYFLNRVLHSQMITELANYARYTLIKIYKTAVKITYTNKERGGVKNTAKKLLTYIMYFSRLQESIKQAINDFVKITIILQ